MIDRRLMLVTVLALVAGSLAAEAQPAGPVRTIGIIGHTEAIFFEEGLRELGWVEGKNVRFERRTTTDSRKLAQFAAELVRMRVDVIFAGNAPATRATVEITRAIPIITVSADPVKAGVAASLARPGLNVTGFAITQPMGKRLEILVQALPAARRVAFLANPTNPNSPEYRRETEAVAHAIGVKLLTFEVSSPEGIEDVVGAVAKARPDALVAAGDPLFSVSRERLIEAAARHRLPTMWESRAFVEAGGLVSYGADPGELYRRAATYADRILKGTKPADLPIDRATKFVLAINVKTAHALNITIPPPVLLRADRVVQ
jgi:putative ABC transport system substrate-binding protein